MANPRIKALLQLLTKADRCCEGALQQLGDIFDDLIEVPVLIRFHVTVTATGDVYRARATPSQRTAILAARASEATLQTALAMMLRPILTAAHTCMGLLDTAVPESFAIVRKKKKKIFGIPTHGKCEWPPGAVTDCVSPTDKDWCEDVLGGTWSAGNC